MKRSQLCSVVALKHAAASSVAEETEGQTGDETRVCLRHERVKHKHSCACEIVYTLHVQRMVIEQKMSVRAAVCL